METEATTSGDIGQFLRRRRRQLLITMIILLSAAVATALGLPPVYRASATILIEQQDIPQDLVRSTVTSYADQRIQIISQRVMTSTNLSRIIDKYGLYQEARQTETTEEVLERIREDIELQMVSAEVVDPRSGRPTEATIAFTLSYENERPRLAQQVTNELVSLYLNENIRSRREQAAEASDFLSDEAEKWRARVSELETKLADFKEKNVGLLPEMVQLNTQIMERKERELMEVSRQIRALKERRILLEAQLAQIDPSAGIISASGRPVLGPADRLKALQAEYVSKIAVYSPSHPDIVRMRKEIDALTKEVGGLGDPKELRARLIELRGQLSEKHEKYSDSHPDVERLTHAISALEDALQRAKRDPAATKTALTPDNPAYIQISAELEAANAELRAFHQLEREIRARLNSYEEKLTRSPQVEREYRGLTREYENALTKYKEIQAKQGDAQLAEELEKDEKGERLSLIESPLLPEKPTKPNRIAILFVGLVVSIAGGFGGAAVSERLDHSVQGVKDLTRILNAPPLVVVPYIATPADVRRGRWGKIGILFLMIALGGTALALVHLFHTPLDVLWYAALRRMGA